QPGKKGEPIKPKFLGGAALAEPATPPDAKDTTPAGKLPPKPAFSRKEKFAAWATAADNPWFARAAVNRIWSQFMGRGIVHPVDDLSDKHQPSHPELFDALTRELIAHKFDTRWLIREIVLSNAYQVGDTGPETSAQPVWFERARVRPLTMEELMVCIPIACG